MFVVWSVVIFLIWI